MLPRSLPKTTLALLAGLLWPTSGVHALPANSDHGLGEVQAQMGNEWQMIKNDKRRHIVTYAKLEDNKRIRSFRVEGILNSRMETIARVLLDFANYPKWYWEVREIRLLKQTSPTDYYLYLMHRAPYGLPDRDVILHATLHLQHPGQPYVLLNVRAVPDYLPETPSVVRMPAEDMSIRFTPLPGDRVQIEAEGFIDPGGKVPPWDANLIQRNAPYTVVLGFQRMVVRDEYRLDTSPLPFQVHDHADAEKP